MASSHSLSAADRPVLPRYDLDITLDTLNHSASLKQVTTWTNTTRTATDEMVFNFYPHYRVPTKDLLLFSKTLEMLRLQPSLGISLKGRHGEVVYARVIGLAGRPVDIPVTFSCDPDLDTVFRFKLPQPVNPGETVSLEMVCELTLPNTQGRLGYWEGVSYLTNSTPILAFRDDSGWRPMPFVPWHQPWFNEAGEFRLTMTLPVNEVLVTPAINRLETQLPNGWKRIETEAFVGRDFAILASPRFQEFRTEAVIPNGKNVPIRCFAFPEHAFYARETMRISAEAIPYYTKWFGPYPAAQFTLVESYFGWNGNECAGLVMIDERVMGMPHLAIGYVEYLVSHETCHQWWYNLIGTNGYAETFMDEGAATYFAHRMLDCKLGKNNDFMNWPDGMKWLPPLKRENYRYGSMYHAIRNGEMQPAAQPLPDYHSLYGLFTGAYDRGSKVFGMIEDQLGEAAYFDFLHMLVSKYAWRVLQARDFQLELEAYTGRSWSEFFERWVYSKGMTDWAVESVQVTDAHGTEIHLWDRVKDRIIGHKPVPSGNHYTASVVVRQKGDYLEPTVVELSTNQPGFEGMTVRVPVGAATSLEFPELQGNVVPLGNDQWRVDVALPFAPDQIVVDPDHVLLDSNPLNNAWQPKANFRLSACQTMLDETPLTADYDAWNWTAGPWVWGPSYLDPWYTRSTMGGVRVGTYMPGNFSAGIYSAFRTDFNDLVVGADATWQGDHSEVGFNWERRIAGPWGGLNGDSGPERFYGYYRDIIKATSSLYLEPVMYQDAFATYQDNFLPFPRQANGDRYNHLALAGYHYQWNMYTPYWDPEGGFFLDLVGAAGGAEFNNWQGVVQGRFQLAGVETLPDWMGPLQGWRAAARFVAEGAWPNHGQFYSLGSDTLYRGFDLAQRQGNALLVGNLEMRVPLVRDIEWDTLDHVVGARNIWAVGFYDVGEVFSAGHSVDGVAHALGVGLRVDIALFSFIERATLRFDAAKTINAATPMQFWLGISQAF